MICKKEEAMVSIPPTIPMHQFAKVSVKSPMHSFVMYLEVGLNVFQVVSKLAAESVPAKLEVVIQGLEDVKFPLPNSLSMTPENMNLWANVPSCLLLCEQSVKATSWPFVAALHPKGIVVVARQTDLRCVDVAAAVVHFSEEWDAINTDFLGRKLDDQSISPNVIFLCDPGTCLSFTESVPGRPVFTMLAESHVTQMRVRDIHAFIHWLERTGIHAAIRALGWHILVQLNVDPDEDLKEVILAPRVGRLAVTPQAIAPVSATRIF